MHTKLEHAGMILGMCTGAQAGVPDAYTGPPWVHMALHRWTPRYFFTTKILHDQLPCPSCAPAHPLQESAVTKLPPIYNTRLLPSNVGHNQQNTSS